MQAKLIAIFTNPSGLALVIAFLLGGLQALGSHGGSITADLITVLSALGAVFHPTNLVGGHKA